MTDNSENSDLLIESQETNPKIQEKEETIPINQEAAPMGAEQKEEVVQAAAPGALKPVPKSRGRPAGSKDNKPRIKMSTSAAGTAAAAAAAGDCSKRGHAYTAKEAKKKC